MAVIIAYKILEAASMQEIEALVKEAISKGWQPIGGIAVSGGRFYQAMGGH
jgi:hypothetical protein